MREVNKLMRVRGNIRCNDGVRFLIGGNPISVIVGTDLWTCLRLENLGGSFGIEVTVGAQ